MKVLGLIGGMSWESTVPYYRVINQHVAARLGGLHSAEMLLYSVDFQPVETLQHAGRWDETGAMLAGIAARLERAGARAIVLCTNTMHRVAGDIESAVSVPLLHIADATAARIREAGVRRVGLLGTAFTMEQDFYRGRLSERHGIDVLVPEQAGRALVHRVIYEELCLGKVCAASRERFVEVVDGLRREGAEAVILGCTEIAMLIGPGDTDVPLFDTTEIHARGAAEWALDEAQ